MGRAPDMDVSPGAQMVLICFNHLVQKQNPSTVSGKRTVDLANTLIKAKSPFANVLYSKLGKASQQKAQPHLPAKNSDMQFSGLQEAAISSTEFSSSAAATSLVSPFGLTFASWHSYYEQLSRCKVPWNTTQDFQEMSGRHRTFYWTIQTSLDYKSTITWKPLDKHR